MRLEDSKDCRERFIVEIFILSTPLLQIGVSFVEIQFLTVCSITLKAISFCTLQSPEEIFFVFFVFFLCFVCVNLKIFHCFLNSFSNGKFKLRSCMN